MCTVVDNMVGAGGDGAAAAGAMIDIQHHDPRRLKERAEYAVAYPGEESCRGVEVLKDSAGNLMFRAFRPGDEQGL